MSQYTFIDADAHGEECESTWSHREEQFPSGTSV